MGISIRCGAQVVINDILGKWARCDQPPYSSTDYPYLQGAWNMAETDTADLRALIEARPIEECIALRGFYIGTSGEALSTDVNDHPHPDMPVISWVKAGGYALSYGSSATQLFPQSIRCRLSRTSSLATIATGECYYLGYAQIYTKTAAQGFIATLPGHVTGWYQETPGSGVPIGTDNLYHGWIRVALSPIANDSDNAKWLQISQDGGGNCIISTRIASINTLVSEVAEDPSNWNWHQIDAIRLPTDVSDFCNTPSRDFKIEVYAGKVTISCPQSPDAPYVTTGDTDSAIFYSNRDADIGNQLYGLWIGKRAVYKDKSSESYDLYQDAFLDTSLCVKRFYQQGTWESAEHQLGFNPMNNPSFALDCGTILPSGTSATVTLIDPVTAKYALTLTGSTATGTLNGVDFCDFSPTARAITYSYAPIYSHHISLPQAAEPQRLHISHRFDYNSLQIRSHTSLEFNNNLGQCASIFREMGQKSCEINLFSTHFSNGLPFRQFTGIVGRKASIEGAAGSSTYTMEGTDRSVQVDNPRWDLPWSDGWNEMYFQAFLSTLAGIHPSDLAYLPYIPNSPFNIDLGDETGSPAWFLPVGAAGTALTRFSGVSLWQIKSKLAQAVGKMLFYDIYGKEQYLKFQGASFGVKRSYFEDDAYGPFGIQHIVAGKSLEDVRNQITVVGIDAFGPLWSPIVSHQVDQQSLNNPAAFNHIGYSQPFVWADNLFANLGFASEAAARMINFLRLPSIHVSFTTHLNPDLYPLDTITIQCPRVGISGFRMMVVGVDHLIHDGTLGETMITARWMGS